jgi:uncharacterized protein YbjT (DUF2867 family)
MYVITGASGNCGHVVAEKLLDAGKKVRAIGRSAERLQDLRVRGAELFVCDLTERTALAKGFEGAEGVFVMIPPSSTSSNYRKEQDGITDSVAAAIEKAGVKHVMSLSSFGADKAKGTGPVAGLHNLETKLNAVSGLNVLHLRAGYFMENTLAQIGIIKALGAAAGPLRAEVALPLIATRDIGAYAAQALTGLRFSGQQTHELQGQRDINMAEIASIIGTEIGRPGLAYKQLPNDLVRKALTDTGMSQNVADLILEMAEAINSGHMAAIEKRSAENTTPTSFETFAKEIFAPQFKGKSTAA